MSRLQATAPAFPLAGARVATPQATDEHRELWLRPDPRELRRARWLAEAAAVDHGLDEDESFRFKFAVNEAVANAIEHGEPSEDGYILLRARPQGDDLCFEVHDWGSFRPDLAGADSLSDRGRGLALMAAMVDEVDVRPRGGTTVVRLLIRPRASV
jgi:anti-sigma regulatory factor (Ser/Thr protein kinase)